MKTLDAVLHEAMEWRRQTFEPSPTDHLCLRLVEEAYELKHASPADKPGELADVLIFLAAIAEAEGVDLAEAVEEKLAINRTRTWPK